MAYAVVTFTRRSTEEILETGGSQAWRLSPIAARENQYLVCARNKRHVNSQGPEPHLTGFLIGKISDIVPSPENESRYVVKISEWAPLNIPNLWSFGRNPVHYTHLDKLGIKPDDLDFQPLPKPKRAIANNGSAPGSLNGSQNRSAHSARALTISEAKAGLALTFGVPPEAIEVTIRG
jgi:hypothetical protein